MLSITNHDRDKAGLNYVYPVLSRRSNGLSIGINLNINNACNWKCLYCQVPDLVRGSAPPVNLDQLEAELCHFLDDVIHGNFYDREVIPNELRIIKDIAISGNGEPTTAKEFEPVINLIEFSLKKYRLLNNIKCVLITNGSMVKRNHIQTGLSKLKKINGEVWFKVDSVTKTGIAQINQTKNDRYLILERLKITAKLCPTWIQTCFFSFNDKPPSEIELSAYFNFLDIIVKQDIPIKGVYLYGMARPSMQTEAHKIKRLPRSWFQRLVKKLKFPFEIIITP